MHSRQIKSIEKLIINNLNNSIVKFSFAKVLAHFADEDFLHYTNHSNIHSAIYLNNLYKHKSVRFLCIHFNLDNKTLLYYRKLYVSLFAKYYLNLSSISNLDFLRLFTELSKLSSSITLENIDMYP